VCASAPSEILAVVLTIRPSLPAAPNSVEVVQRAMLRVDALRMTAKLSFQ